MSSLTICSTAKSPASSHFGEPRLLNHLRAMNLPIRGLWEIDPDMSGRSLDATTKAQGGLDNMCAGYDLSPADVNPRTNRNSPVRGENPGMPRTVSATGRLRCIPVCQESDMRREFDFLDLTCAYDVRVGISGLYDAAVRAWAQRD